MLSHGSSTSHRRSLGSLSCGQLSATRRFSRPRSRPADRSGEQLADRSVCEDRRPRASGGYDRGGIKGFCECGGWRAACGGALHAVRPFRGAWRMAAEVRASRHRRADPDGVECADAGGGGGASSLRVSALHGCDVVFQADRAAASFTKRSRASGRISCRIHITEYAENGMPEAEAAGVCVARVVRVKPAAAGRRAGHCSAWLTWMRQRGGSRAGEFALTPEGLLADNVSRSQETRTAGLVPGRRCTMLCGVVALTPVSSRRHYTLGNWSSSRA